MAKKPSTPIKVTAHLADGRINSINGIIMLDAVLYHAWFQKHAPHVLEGRGTTEWDGHIGLPLVHLPGNRYAASKGVFEEVSRTVEHINKRPDFFNADKIDRLDMDKGIISSSVGQYRAYRIPMIIHTVKDGIVTFYGVGRASAVSELLNTVVAVGKKYAAGYGIVTRWDVEECDEDYSTWHPEYGLMRPLEVDAPECEGRDMSTYPKMRWAVRPPYWKQCNAKLCYVPMRADDKA